MNKKVMIMLSILLTFTMCKKKEVEEITTYNEQINGHEYVDLGLPSGLKWATCNVGASLPSEYGNYYAWGEIEPKDNYTQENEGENRGYRVTGTNGNSIFLPAAGYWRGTLPNADGMGGYCWSSTPGDYHPQNAYNIIFYSENSFMHWYYRDYGLSVRPVSE